MKLRSLIISWVAIVFLQCLGAVLVFSIENDANAVIINNVSVPLDEFMLVAGGKKALVYDYFLKRYGVRPKKTFWEMQHGNETPLEKLKEMVFNELVDTKVMQQLAQQYGLVQDISYGTFLANWQKENMRRKTAIAQGKVIYGPVQYSRAVYYDYVNSNLDLDLRRVFMRSGKTSEMYDDWIKENVSKATVVITDEVISRYIRKNKF